MKQSFDIQGMYVIECEKDGIILARHRFRNAIVNEGKNSLLNTMFSGVAKADWYFGLIASGATLSINDTLASHAGWTEVTDYANDRKIAVWPGPSTARSISTENAVFVMEDDVTLRGAFLCNAETGAVGTLWSTGLFPQFLAPDTASVRVSYEVDVK
jgi:hypothetical protein